MSSICYTAFIRRLRMGQDTHGLHIFNFAQSELETIDPFLEGVVYTRMIDTGKHTANNRLAKGE